MNNSNCQLSSIPSDQIGKPFLETNLKSNLHTLIGPYPYIKKSNSKLKSLKVIPLSDTSTKVNSPMFYCICSKNENLINKNGLVSYYHKQTYDGNTYIISKYTDRVTMRLYLLKCFDNNEDMVDFALFVLENLHFIKINSLYLSISNEVVVFDLYSFINNVFVHYSINQNILSYSKLSSENLRGKVNYTINSMGVLVNGNTYYSDDGQSVSNAYAYFTYRYPILAPNDTKEIIQSMYGTNPNRDRIVNEGRLKNTYTWPTNKPMTISINKLYYRVNSEPYKLCSNTPLDIQYLRSLADSNSVGIYDPFDFKSLAPNLDDDDSSDDDNNESGNDNHEKKHNKKRNMMDEISLDDPQYSATFNGGSRGDVDIPDVQLVNYDLFFGRLVIVSPKNVRFTAEICYDCTLVR